MTSDTINYSEFAALGRCETAWGYGYAFRQEESGPRTGLHKGTLLHVAGDRWLRGLGATLPEEWTDDINTGGKPGEERTLRLADFDPDVVADVQWLSSRYEQHYGPKPPDDWEIVSAEEWLTCTWRGITLVGRTDGIFRDGEGKLWLRELKSYGTKGIMSMTDILPQLTVYYILVEANYGPLHGILMDGIYTYHWKPKQRTLTEIEDELRAGPHTVLSKADLRLAAKRVQATEPGIEREPAESFQREWADRTLDQLDIGVAYLEAAVARRYTLLLSHDVLAATVPNVSSICKSCGFRPQCWSRLTGGAYEEEPEVEVDDDELEPV